MRAQTLVQRLSKYGSKIMRSSIDRLLKRDLSPFERSGSYVLHSMNVLIETGMSTDEVLNKHAEIVELVTATKDATLRELDNDQ